MCSDLKKQHLYGQQSFTRSVTRGHHRSFSHIPYEKAIPGNLFVSSQKIVIVINAVGDWFIIERFYLFIVTAVTIIEIKFEIILDNPALQSCIY